MCVLCVQGPGRRAADHARIVDLLALVEHPDALAADAALRIARDLLAWAGPAGSRIRCDAVKAPVAPPDPYSRRTES